MIDAFTTSLILPGLVLAFIGFLVPKLLSYVFPEGVRPLILNGIASAVILYFLGVGFFVGLYLIQGIPVGTLTDAGLFATVWHFGKLGALTAFFWLPIMLLSLANQPRHWKEAEW